jgi:hypothetical protein
MSGYGERIGRVLRRGSVEQVAFWCPGCNSSHTLSVSGAGAIWGWNGDADRPTFTPSVLVTSGHFIASQAGKRCWCDYNREQIAAGKDPAHFECGICHSFVTDGRIQFLADSTHKLAGQTVDLPEFER